MSSLPKNAALIEIRFMFQTAPNKRDERTCFYVRAVPGAGEAPELLVDILGTTGGDAVESLDPSMLDVIAQSIEVVRKLKLPPVVEQGA